MWRCLPTFTVGRGQLGLGNGAFPQRADALLFAPIPTTTTDRQPRAASRVCVTPSPVRSSLPGPLKPLLFDF